METDKRKSRFALEQAIAIPAKQEHVSRTAELGRNHDIGEVKIFKRQTNFGRIELLKARKLKTLQADWHLDGRFQAPAEELLKTLQRRRETAVKNISKQRILQ